MRFVGLPFGDELESNDLTGAFAAAFINFTEGALSNRVQHVILIHL